MKWTILTLALLTLASCQTKDNVLDPTQAGFFPEDTGEVRKPNLFADRSAAAGARADGTLFAHHFDGSHLNSLGEQKLALMLQDGAAPTPLTVHLSLDPQSTTSKMRQAAVTDFLKDKGLTDAQIEIVYGDNPAARTPAAPQLQRISKTELGSAEAPGGAGGVSASAPPGGGAPSGSDTGGLFGGAGK